MFGMLVEKMHEGGFKLPEDSKNCGCRKTALAITFPANMKAAL